ncbi:MAG: hypothetical protein AAFX99_07645, partial [Myxococcota bacterium]
SRQCPIALDKIPAHVIKVHPVGDLSGRGRDMLGRNRKAVKEALDMAASPSATLFIREGSSLFEKASQEIRRMVPGQGYAYWVAASSYTAPKLHKEKLVPGFVQGTFVVYSFKHGEIVCGAPVAAQSSASVQFSMRSGVDRNSTQARERYLRLAADKINKDLAQNVINALKMEGALSFDPNAKSSVL